MASGDSVIQILKWMPPATLGAELAIRAGGSTPAENYIVWEFSPTVIWYMDFLILLQGYTSLGLTMTVPWSANGTATGNVIWSYAFRAIPDDTEDMDTSHTYLYNEVTDAAPTVDGEVTYPTIAFTDGADMDSLADGEMAILRVRRNATAGGDTMNSNNAQLWLPFGIET